MDDSDWFSPTYEVARDRFRAAAGDVGWPCQPIPLGGRGPSGDVLTLDVARSPGRDDAPVLLISSALHGIEGFFGSAVQLAVMHEWKAQPPAGLRVVLLHALNPYGFAWLRRTDADNVDLNRNFLLPGEEYAGAPELYRRIDPFLNPKRPPSRWEPVASKGLALLARYGSGPLRQAIAEGQYEYPQGLFFGGSGPSPLQELLAGRLAEWLGGTRHAVHIDLHTGLGRWGTYKILVDPQLPADRTAWIVDSFGRGVVERSEPGSVAYRVRGGIGPWCAACCPTVRYDYVCAEFGTYSSFRVLRGLRAENQAHFWGRPGDDGTRRAKDRLKELLGPASPTWRRTVVARGRRVIEQAVARWA